ncbi:MAG: hypothetical protein M3Q45_07565, partial [Chloroflexota bacterium]|nr:hypothetical protein [Chloroflexota bacterium]
VGIRQSIIMTKIPMIALIFTGCSALFCKSDAKTFAHTLGISADFLNCPPPSSECRLNPNRILQNHSLGIS